MTDPSTAEDLRLYRRLLTYVLPYKWVFLLAIGGMLMVSAGDASIAVMLKPIIDAGFVDRDLAFIEWVPLLLILLGVTRAAGTFIDAYCMSWVARRVIQDLRQLMFESLIRAPVPYYDRNSSGVLTSRLTFNVERIAMASTGVLRTLIRDAFKMLFLLAWMFYLSWVLSLLFAAILPFAYIVFKFSSHHFRKINLRVQETVGDITHVAREALQGQNMIKIFGAYDYQSRLFLRANNRNRQHIMKAAAVSAASVPLMVLLSGTGVAGVIWVALKLDLTPGTFASYLAAMIMTTKPVRSLSEINLAIQSGLAGAQTVFDTVDLESEPDPGATALTEVVGDVRFERVSFAYGQRGKPVLRDISFNIAAGTTVALVGASGSGKSTIASLLLRFYAPTGGRIRIDGQPLDSVTLKSLRDHIAIVTQDIILFDDSIRNNIAYGEPGVIDPDKLARAASAANVMEFAEDAPDGLDTIIGERGVRLSGGQRQRIAIARALYKDAPLLILDEATSSLDSRSEVHIQDAIAQLVKNRTSLIIAHRLSTIHHADLIVVLDKGRIVQQGNHEQLLAEPGIYAKLHQLQYRDRVAQPA
ncbi:MAG: lipid A export permease/ATP-binding protein MsbA [Gammaproteobacteria bacterium]|nr:lipid A export permease/ATP-binding protein MsbA [Gammaproteobacteria bacterium]